MTVAGQVGAAGKAASCDRAALDGLRQNIGKRGGTNGIDGARPAFPLKRCPLCGEFGPVDEAGRAKVRQIVMGFRPSCRCGDLIAALGQKRDGHGTDATGSAGHQDLALVRPDPAPSFESIDREGGGIAGGADRHAFPPA